MLIAAILDDDSEFSDVTLASEDEDDNDNSDMIVLKKLEKFSKREDLQEENKMSILFDTKYALKVSMWVMQI